MASINSSQSSVSIPICLNFNRVANHGLIKILPYNGKIKVILTVLSSYLQFLSAENVLTSSLIVNVIINNIHRIQVGEYVVYTRQIHCSSSHQIHVYQQKWVKSQS
ncbi:unnamed protein product [Schistosoma spindalis]|nr:unnamed protein product [Schistosoma spindale]